MEAGGAVWAKTIKGRIARTKAILRIGVVLLIRRRPL